MQSDWDACQAERQMCFAICFIGIDLKCRENTSKNWRTAGPAHCSEPQAFMNLEARLCGTSSNERSRRARLERPFGPWFKTSAVARLTWKHIGPHLNWPHDLDLGLEWSYERQEEIWGSRRMQMEEKYNSSGPSLTPNQPMERTLPRCALQRRSSAR